ncbi:manganese efflux pump MntP family protein [Arenibacterium halophilum]|uniref:Putative manganese efflux pump MntP n=1 Tax=Arenibacterium halophilum TaxID=2583821 RepID=A0ABY2XC23_9RHOB|nr:manganese efflux pump MntP family protein [Arenibacterium halophilum]TMV14573.1 manganese efflux pump [Arenibacterium halophilum]
MTPLSIAAIAIAMSLDSFVVALASNARPGPRPSLTRALKTGAVFGAVEAATPVIGWAIGTTASQFIVSVDHWIAFALLAAVGVRMMMPATRDATPAPTTVMALLFAAVATSIDAMAVGVSLAFAEVNILVVALATGFTTMAMAATGHLAGRMVGFRAGRVAEIAGGIALVGIGALILMEHLAA